MKQKGVLKIDSGILDEKIQNIVSGTLSCNKSFADLKKCPEYKKIEPLTNEIMIGISEESYCKGLKDGILFLLKLEEIDLL